MVSISANRLRARVNARAVDAIAVVIAAEQVGEPEQTAIPSFEDVQLAQRIFDRVFEVMVEGEPLSTARN